MEPRKEVLTQKPEQPKEERKRRFQIMKLEERIAPCVGAHLGHGGGNGCRR